jgi:hypothetical protein
MSCPPHFPWFDLATKGLLRIPCGGMCSGCLVQADLGFRTLYIDTWHFTLAEKHFELSHSDAACQPKQHLHIGVVSATLSSLFVRTAVFLLFVLFTFWNWTNNLDICWGRVTFVPARWR